MKRFALILPLFAVLGCDVEVDHATEVTYLNMPGMPDGLPFSSAVRAGNTLYLSSKLGNIPGTMDLAEGGIAVTG